MNWLDKMYLKGEKKNQTTRQQIKNNKKYLLTNIILNYTERDNAEDFCAKVNDFQSNGTTKNEMYREIPDYLSYPSIKKNNLILHRQILQQHKFKLPGICAIEKIGGVQHEASLMINIFGNEVPPSLL